jgi:hypothetical protein
VTDDEPIPIETPDRTPKITEPHPPPRPGQSDHEKTTKSNPPKEGTNTQKPSREEALAGTDKEQTIPLPTKDMTPEVAEAGSNPVARLIRRLTGR